VAPAALDFGAVRVGEFADRRFTIRNTGGGVLNGAVSEACADYSILSGGGVYALAAGESLAVTIRFAPLADGPLPCTIETGVALCVDVACTGAGIGPACAVNPVQLDFSALLLGEVEDKTFEITNTGGGVLSGSVAEAVECPDFAIVAGGGAYALGAGATRVVTVRFSPLVAGPLACTIETGSVLCADVQATGDGCEVCPPSPDQRNATEDVTVENDHLRLCSEAELRVGSDIVGLTEYEALLYFPIDDLPASAEIISAHLEIDGEGCSGLLPPDSVTIQLTDPDRLFECTEPDTVPGRAPLALCSTEIPCQGPAILTCEGLRALCQLWVEDPGRNHGVGLERPTGGLWHLLVRSREGVGVPPRLVLTFTCPCP
jgi:hypothetical protein